jgi:hypothetical protein
MTIVRREHRAHFTVLPNAIFVDHRLPIEAKGETIAVIDNARRPQRGCRDERDSETAMVNESQPTNDNCCGYTTRLSHFG